MWTRTAVGIGIVGAVLVAGTAVPMSARRQDPKPVAQQDQKQDQKKDPKTEPQGRGRQSGPDKPKPKEQPRAEPQRAQPQRGQQQRAEPQRGQAQGRPRVAKPEQERRIGAQQQRLTQFSAQLDVQQRLSNQRGAQLQQQKRNSQFAFQQSYMARLNDQQQRLRNSRSYNYAADPFFYTPSSYRYTRAGRVYATNEYGAGVLRQAVNDGYEQGFGAGMADRQDRWAFSFQDSFAYQDANYGYSGFYVDRDDYNYYFREGFRRGYDDGYYGRTQYGVRTSGRLTVLGGVVAIILGLQAIR